MVFTCTTNEHQYSPDLPPRYALGVIELDEQAGLRVPAAVMGCDPGEVRIGLRVHVVFEDHGEVFVPVFSPARGSV